MAQQNRRKRFLVAPRVQHALGARLAVHWLIFLVASIVVTTLLRAICNVNESSFSEVLATALSDQMVPVMVIVSLLPWFLYDSLKLSNRFAGPMVRLKHAIRELTDNGHSNPIRFRKDDYWQEMAVDFNRLQERFQLNSRHNQASEIDIADSALSQHADEPVNPSEHCIPLAIPQAAANLEAGQTETQCH